MLFLLVAVDSLILKLEKKLLLTTIHFGLIGMNQFWLKELKAAKKDLLHVSQLIKK